MGRLQGRNTDWVNINGVS